MCRASKATLCTVVQILSLQERCFRRPCVPYFCELWQRKSRLTAGHTNAHSPHALASYNRPSAHGIIKAKMSG